MKKILFFFNSIKPSGGIERVIVTLANRLCDNYDITIVVKDQSISFYDLDDRIKFVSLNNTLEFDMKSKFNRFFSAFNSVILNTKALKSYLKEETFDYYYLAHPLNVLEFHFARGVNNKDTIISEHGASDAYNQIYKKIKRWLYPKAKVYVVPTTTDTLFYQSLKFPAQYLPHFKSDLHYEKAAQNENIALSIGRFTDVKQQIILLQIWNSLVNEKQIKNWKLFLVGEGELKSQFKLYINTNNLQDHVFLKSPRQDVEFYYKQASLFLLTSKTEGFGMVLLEAISFGLPCISFDCPSGPRDIIRDAENGFLIALNDQISYEKAVVKFIKNPNLIKAMGIKSFSISQNWKDSELLNSWINIFN